MDIKKWLKFSEEIEAEAKIKEVFLKIDKTAFINQMRVMTAFQKQKISESHFMPTTGYGYDDRGRDTLDKVYADIFEAEDAFVRHSIVSGTQALCIGLFGLLRTGDTLLSVTGKPYDTLEEVIGIRGNKNYGSLSDYGIKYMQTELAGENVNYDEIGRILKNNNTVKVVFIQRSKGYSVRPTLSAKKIGEIADFVHKTAKDIFVVVDNCYGEFCEEHEPTYYGADMIIGSLIKNPGGGMAESGGYIAGTKKAVELASYRLTCPGIGRECGASLGQTKNIYKGIFFAPHTTAQALKTAVFASRLFEKLGFEVSPKFYEERYDIIQTITFGDKRKLLSFCAGIQSGSPIDSHVTPEPWDMPGYAVQVVMAAGAFTQGASIELSADAPMLPPFTVYMQGGLTYESGKLGILFAADKVSTNI